MSNTINLLPSRSKEQIKKETKHFAYDFVTAAIILVVVIIGVATIFVNSFLQYNISQLDTYIKEATTTLSSYKTLAAQYQSVQVKVAQINTVKKKRVNPSDAINYITGILPSGSQLSNFSLDSSNNYTVTISNTNYISVAKFLVTLEQPNLRVKSTEVNEISFDSTSNIFNFKLSGIYTNNG